MSDFELKKGDLAGFDLGGYRQINGTIKLSNFFHRKRYIKAWPEEISLHGVTYTLENVVDGAVNEKTGELWQNAIYV